jgi:hypothetical protein
MHLLCCGRGLAQVATTLPLSSDARIRSKVSAPAGSPKISASMLAPLPAAPSAAASCRSPTRAVVCDLSSCSGVARRRRSLASRRAAQTNSRHKSENCDRTASPSKVIGGRRAGLVRFDSRTAHRAARGTGPPWSQSRHTGLLLVQQMLVAAPSRGPAPRQLDPPDDLPGGAANEPQAWFAPAFTPTTNI